MANVWLLTERVNPLSARMIPTGVTAGTPSSSQGPDPPEPAGQDGTQCGARDDVRRVVDLHVHAARRDHERGRVVERPELVFLGEETSGEERRARVPTRE